jgi:hypothetical protein
MAKRHETMYLGVNPTKLFSVKKSKFGRIDSRSVILTVIESLVYVVSKFNLFLRVTFYFRISYIKALFLVHTYEKFRKKIFA